MKLVGLALFGAGYVMGTKAGRERYEQIRLVAKSTADRLSDPTTRDRFRAYADRLESYGRASQLDLRSQNGSPTVRDMSAPSDV